ncbi:MAG: DUF3224 domain-containing protein [Acidobacteriota bacterium]
MSTRATATFGITGGDATTYEEPAAAPGDVAPQAPTLSRATVTKNLLGDIVGKSKAELLMCGGADGASGGYLAQERVEGRLAERTGTFVLQHGGLRWGGGQKAFGSIVPGSATSELRGLTGEATFAHDENGARLTLDYNFE